jgi:prophage maintenance system killer protein
MVFYPTKEFIVALNELVLRAYPEKKADRHKIIKGGGLDFFLSRIEKQKFNEWTLALYLFRGLIQGHYFDSGNRRTAYFVLFVYFVSNDIKCYVTQHMEDNPNPFLKLGKNMMTGIRENFYSDEEIIQWFKIGEIRKFIR